MSMSYLAAHLRARQIELWLDDDQLRYRAPKSALSEDMIALLKGKKPVLIDHIRTFGPIRPAGDLIAAVDTADSYPLSPDQEPLWFLDQIRNGSPSDHLCRAFDLEGVIDANGLEQAFRQLIARHESLRTVFRETSNGPAQTVLPTMAWTLEQVDLTSFALGDAIEEARWRCGEQTRKRIDLENGPLFLAVLFKLSAERHVLLIVMHHLIGDGHSFAILGDELGEAYAAVLEDRKAWLPSPARQYKDFAAYRSHQTKPDDIEANADYWRSKLDGVGQVVELPLDRQRPAVQSSLGARAFFDLSSETVDALRQVGQQQGATLFMTLLAAFFTLLKRQTGQSDLIVGAPVSLRDRAEFETMMGMCLNMSIFSIDVAGGLTFGDLLDRVQKTVVDAFAHQRLPFQQLVSAVRPRRDLSRNQIFQIMFQLSPLNVTQLRGLKTSLFDFDPGTAQFDLSVHLFELDGGLRGYFEYDSELFEADRMKRMVDQFDTLLAAVIADPNQSIERAPILPEAERQLVLNAWNQTGAPYPHDLCLHQMFEQQAALTPERRAVVFEQDVMTYAELNALADRLAASLLDLDVGRGSFVGINMARSIDMVAALLAVLKTGAAYLPLDPSFPKERLAFMVDDSGADVVLTNLPNEARIARDGVKVVDVDDIKQWSRLSDRGPTHTPSSDDLAYIIYTSGSTGRPKGVQIQHQAVVNFLTAMAKQPGLHAADRLLSVTTLSFDISVLEIFLPLSVGAELLLVGQDVVVDAERLRASIETSEPTVMQATPSTWQMLLDSGWSSDVGLKKLSGGEAMPLSLARSLAAQPGSLWNMYGPTETTIWSSVLPIEPDGDHVPIGGPIANTTFYVVDANLEPVPLGVPGELLIGGDGLAKGYWNRADLTAERFIANPFDTETATRLYRTGDLVRQRSDGTIQFVGRLDHQVKLRGFRIELGEIERTLVDHPAVKEAVVIVGTDDHGEKRLVAYVIEESEAGFLPDEMRAHMRKTLPAYMIPAVFVPLTAWPLTPNGKIDRKRLPAPSQTRQTTVTYVAPDSWTERTLADIWKPALGLPKVGIHDNFFDLGGDSLMALNIISRARSAGINLSASQLFDLPTIAELAVAAESRADDFGDEPTDPADDDVPADGIPLPPFMQRFLDRPGSKNPHRWNLAYIGKGRRRLSVALLREAFDHLFERHDAMRLRLDKEGYAWRARIDDATDAKTGFSVIDLSNRPSHERKAALEAKVKEMHSGFHLSDGPVIQFAVFEMGEDEPQRFFLVGHHFAIDGISIGIFWQELETIYRQLERRETPSLPEATSTFRGWIADLRKLANSAPLSNQVNRWLQKPWPIVQALPTDYPNTGPLLNTNASARPLTKSLSVEETARLWQCTTLGFNAELIFITAMASALTRFQDTRHAFFNRLIHGRDISRVDVAGSLGCFISYASTLIELGQDQPMKVQLDQVKQQMREQSYIGTNIDLTRYMSQDADLVGKLQALPRAEVLLNYRGKTEDLFARSGIFEQTSENTGDDHDPDGVRDYPLSVVADVIDQRLQITFVYSSNLHCRETIDRMAEDGMTKIRATLDELVA